MDRIKIPKYIIKKLFENKIVIFLCLLTIFPFWIKPIFSENYTSNNSYNIINQSENIANITCSENYTFINGTCQNNILLNLTQSNKTFIEFNPCLNISCKDDYKCNNGKCVLNLFYFNVDPNIIDGFNYKEKQSIIITLNSNDNLDKKSNLEKINYFKEFENDFIFNLTSNKLNENIIVLDNRFSSFPGFSAIVTIKGLKELATNPIVKKIEMDMPLEILLDKSNYLINSDDVWNYPFYNDNLAGLYQTVCIIDAGIDPSHPNLKDSIIYEKCFCNSNCCPNNQSEDENAEEYLNFHGTFVAGIVASNNTNYKGIAYNANIIPVKVMDSYGSGTTADLINAIEWCTNNADTFNISVITISLGFNFLGIYPFSSIFDCEFWNSDMSTAVNNAIQKGIFVDAASGNDASSNGMRCPACLSNVTSVGSSNNNRNTNNTWTDPNPDCTDYFSFADQVSCGSNRANFMDLFAPGAIIISTYTDGGFGEGIGTSFAAPHVAGVAALMKQANNSLTPFDIRSIMKRTGVSVYDPNSTLTFPRVDAYRSVMASIYDNFVSDTEIVYSDNNRKVISFNVFNDLNQTSGMGWNLSLGNNITRTNNSIADLGAYDDLMVFVEYNYTTSGDYVINSTFGTNWQAIPITVNKEIDIINDSVLCAGCNNRRVFSYNLTSYYGNQVVDWKVDFGDGITSSSFNNFTILENQTIFFFIEHNYSTAQEYLVSAEINSTTMKEYANNMTANITQLE